MCWYPRGIFRLRYPPRVYPFMEVGSLQLKGGPRARSWSKPGARSCCTNVDEDRGCAVTTLFTPYQAKVPWHSGPRAVLSKLFPRYGNYCGPNYSSGRDSGSLLWDKPPIDWLDYCCFVHDIGYDSYSQLDLYKADLAMLDCLTKMPVDDKPESSQDLAREAYRRLAIIGLQNVLLPYRRVLLRGQKLDRADELDENSSKS